MCLHLGRWDVETPGGFLDVCPAYQLQRWIEYFNYEPFGEDIKDQRTDIRTSITFSELVNNIRIIMAGLGGKSIPLLEPDHFRISDKLKKIAQGKMGKVVSKSNNNNNNNEKNKKKKDKSTTVTPELIFRDEMQALNHMVNQFKEQGKVVEDPSPWEPEMVE